MPQCEIKQINTKDLHIDSSYKQGMDYRHFKKLLEIFDPRLMNTIVVSFRDGKYFVLDGETTVAVLKARNGGKDLDVTCKVYFDLTREDEAEWYYRRNMFRRDRRPKRPDEVKTEIDKIKEATFMNNIPQYEIKMINTKDLCIDTYQRELEDPRVKKILKNFNPYLPNIIKVSFRDGKYWVFDGQHTVAALKAHNGGKDLMAECKVFFGLTYNDESELFCLQNGISRSVLTADKLKAAYLREDPAARKLVNTAQSAGWTVDFITSPAQGRLHSLASVCWAFKYLEPNQFYEMLSVIKCAWMGASESVSAEMLRGMSIFVKTYYGLYDRRRLIACLQKISPLAIVRDGKAMAFGGNAKYARVILNAYNKKAHNRLPDKL